MSADFLLEIGCEEIPAWMLPPAQFSLMEQLASEILVVLEGNIETWSTPRRLVASARLKDAFPDVQKNIGGPPWDVAFDAQGHPTQVAIKFAAKHGLVPNQLKPIDSPRGRIAGASFFEKGESTRARLARNLPRIIQGIEFPRTMYWTSPQGAHFIRPIRWIVALLGGKGIEFAVEGVAAGRTTFGHRLLAPKAIAVKSSADYRRKLEQAFVILDPAKRREKIEREAERADRKSVV